MSLLNIDSCTDNSSGLHLSNFRIGNCKTAATVTHHGVELVERRNDVLNILNSFALSSGKSLNVIWTSYIGGPAGPSANYDVQRMAAAIDQAFQQSPYLNKNVTQK